ncbi:MAG TPA: LuxR C-terminal-related transcriptional regulator [Opitutus sp.]|nr:LuxR C-terminal-related transcriptional regulator [Opitutus sp.]
MPGDDLIDRIYGAAVEPETWADVMREIQRAFDAHSITLAFSDNQVALSSLAASRGVFEDQAVVTQYFSYYGGLDIAVPAFVGHQPGKFNTTSRLFAPEVRAGDEFYNDFFVKLGLIDTLGGNVLSDARGTGLICLQREVGRAEFTEADIRAMERLAPHLRRALQMHRQFAPLRQLVGAFTDIVDRLAVGAIILDENGRVFHRNAAAHDIIAQRDGLMLTTAGGLAATDRAANARLTRLVGSVLANEDDAAGGQVIVPRAEGRPPYVVLVAPARTQMLTPFGLTSPRGAVLLINDPDSVARTRLSSAMATYRLTAAELALLERLVAGASLTEYCEERGISINTAKFHLRALFAKTDTHSQVALVRFALIALRLQ